jgi:quercetin dioxygenase-like cupin family protein
MSISKLRSEIRKHWDSNSFIETGVAIPNSIYPLPWVPYESYMRAQLVKATPGDEGLLLVNFPPESSEDNDLHIHPISDRVITVISGFGEFRAMIAEHLQCFVIKSGYRIWMPRGIIHTFMS